MQHCLTGFLPGFSGCHPGETSNAVSRGNQTLTTGRGGCSGSSGFSGSSGDIKERGSESTYYLRLYILHVATRLSAPIHPLISFLAHPEEPEKPEEAQYPEQHPTPECPERELTRQVGTEVDSKRAEGGR
jgi:hypothetical protein